MENTNDNSMEFGLRDVLRLLHGNLWIILLVAILCGALAGVYSFFIADPVYQSTAKLYIQAQNSSATTLSELQVGSTLAHDCVEMIYSQSIARDVIESLNLQMNVKDLQRTLNVSNPKDTRIINITIENTDPEQAAMISNEFARVSQDRLSTIMKTDKPQLWELATPAEKPIKPSKSKNIVMGFLIGLVAMCMITTIRFMLDDSLKTQSDIERYLGLNVLAVLPMIGTNKKKSRKKRRHQKNAPTNLTIY